MCAPSASGGDSEVGFDRQLGSSVGPRKAMPLCLLAHTFPETLADLQRAGRARIPSGVRDAVRLSQSGSRGARASAALERRIWSALDLTPRRVSAAVRNASGLEALAPARRCRARDARRLHAERCNARARRAARLVSRGCGVRSAHSRHRGAQCARRLRRRARRESSASAPMSTSSARSARALLAAALAHDPGLEAAERGLGPARRALARGRRRGTAVVALDAGDARARAAAGRDRGPGRRRITPRWRAGSGPRCPFRSTPPSATRSAQSPASSRKPSRSWSINRASRCSACTIRRAARITRTRSRRSSTRERVSRALALGAARRAGAADPHVDTRVIERRAQVGPGTRLSRRGDRALDGGRPAVRGPRACRAYRINASPLPAYRKIYRHGSEIATRGEPSLPRLPYNRHHEATRRDAGTAQPTPAAERAMRVTPSSIARAPIGICAIRSSR